MFRFFNYLTTHIYLLFGADVNNPNHHFLHSSTNVGNQGTVEYLINSKHADVNLLDNSGKPPVYYALINNSLALLQVYKSHSTDLYKFKDSETGDTLLHTACKFGDEKLVKEFLQNDKSLLNALNNNGATPFVVALEQENVKLAEMLRDEYGATFDSNTDGVKLLKTACINYNYTFAKFLIEKLNVSVDSKDFEGNHLIKYALKSKDITELFIDNGANLNVILSDGKTLLLSAITEGSQGAAVSLVYNGADVNARDLYGKSALYHALKNGYKNVAEALLYKGCFVTQDVTNSTLVFDMLSDTKTESLELLLKLNPYQANFINSGEHVLFTALKGQQNKAAKILKNSGAFINPNDIKAIDLFHSLIKDNKEESVKFMINELYINVNALNSEGRSALSHVFNQNKDTYSNSIVNKNILKELLKVGANVNSYDNKAGKTHLHTAVDMQDELAVDLLLSYGANVNYIDEFQNTPIINATKNNSNLIVQKLIFKGALLQVLDSKTAMTPLQLAIANGNVNLVKLFLESGANLDYKVMQTGDTVLHLAAKLSSSDVMKYLIENINFQKYYTQNNYGKTPLDIALEKGSTSVIDTLKDAIHQQHGYSNPSYNPEVIVNSDKYAPSAPPMDDDLHGNGYLYNDQYAPSAPPMDY